MAVTAVVVNAVLSFLQEGKAERALDAIRHMLSPQAMVLRDGRGISVAAADLVPGDVVLLQSGDKVPADLRLVHVKGLQAQEAALTGESLAVEKRTAPVAADAPLSDRVSMAYSGTLVTRGQGSGVVVATGADAELGRIGGLLAEVETLTTPLLRQIAVFTRWLTGAILVFAVLTFVFGVVVRASGLREIVIAVVSRSGAAVTEGLSANRCRLALSRRTMALGRGSSIGAS